MKKSVTVFLASLLHIIVVAQQKEFEGMVVYRTEVKSKSEIISDRVMKNLVSLGNENTILIKQGNYKHNSGIRTTYYLTKDQRVYYKFNSLDTLYYLDYTFDTSKVKNISRSEEKRNIAGYDCKTITIQAGDITKKYYYAPTLYMNPEYDKNNRISRYDVYAKETSSLCLGSIEESQTYSVSETCIRLQQTEIADSVFKLPNLPHKKFVVEELFTPPEFTRSGGFTKYLETNLDKELGSKYLKIKRGEETASQTVIVRFLVNEYGRVSNAEVENKKEVHSKLAEEALRVVSASPLWKPAIIYGSEKTIYWQKVPIVFMLSKK